MVANRAITTYQIVHIMWRLLLLLLLLMHLLLQYG